MAKIPIWPGSSSFNDIQNPTPFGFYDEDTDFREDADKIAAFVVKRLGYPLVDIELQDVNIYSCFEEAITEYGGQVYTFQIVNNMIDLEGKSTGSSAINNIYIDSNYGITDQGSTQGNYQIEGEVQISPTENTAFKLETGSLSVSKGVQRYDLFTNPASSISGSIDGSIKMHKIYHYSPAAINRYFDPYAGTGTGIQSLMQTFGFGNYSPGVNFMLMPMYFDILKLQAIELNDTIRKSGYHFEIVSERYLKLFPIPTSDYTLHFEYSNVGSTLDADGNETLDSGSSGAYSLATITDISNVPYANPTYKFINAPGRSWIRKYTLALAKEMLGSIRGKYQSLPIPGDTTTLDYSRLLDEAKQEKTDLIAQLREDLEKLTTVEQLDRKSQENLSRTSTLASDGKYQIYIH